MSGVGVLADHLLVVSCSAITTYLCWLCRFPLLDKEGYFVCLLAVAFLPVTVCVLSLSISHGMHLVVPTHPYFFWVACHPSRTLPPKEPEQEPHNIFFPLGARPCSLLPLTHDPPLPILAGYRLVVSESCACFTFLACCLCICRDLEIGLYVLACIFGFLWRGLFSDLPFFITCFFWGLGLFRSWAFLPLAYSVFTLWPY